MSDLRAVVVDDEPLAREGLAELLTTIPGVRVVETFADGPSAVKGIEAGKPDVVFVDINMPGMSGIELVGCLEMDPMPAIVFVTAYNEFAIKAFELNAMDYVLKPPTRERLEQAVTKVGEWASGPSAKLNAVLAALRPRGATRLIVREVGQIIIVQTSDIDWIEGADYYAKLHVGAKIHLIRQTLASLEQRLDPGTFFRVHRSTIVNVGRVRAVEAAGRGDGTVVLLDGTRIRITAARRQALEEALSP